MDYHDTLEEAQRALRPGEAVYVNRPGDTFITATHLEALNLSREVWAPWKPAEPQFNWQVTRYDWTNTEIDHWIIPAETEHRARKQAAADPRNANYLPFRVQHMSQMLGGNVGGQQHGWWTLRKEGEPEEEMP